MIPLEPVYKEVVDCCGKTWFVVVGWKLKR